MNASILKAASLIGSQAGLARRLGVTCATVNQWAKGSRPIPVRWASAIERATGGAVTRQDMFPDKWREMWPELASKQPERLADKALR